MNLYKDKNDSELNYLQRYAKKYYAIEENKNELYKLNKENYYRHREEYLQHKKEKFQEMKKDPILYEAYKEKRREEYHKKKEKSKNI